MSNLQILLVEDDHFKADIIRNCLLSAHPMPLIQTAESVRTAIQAIQTSSFDLIVLDMALPSHNVLPGKGQVTSLLSGGLEVLFELSYKNRSDKVVVVTQYPEIEIEGKLIPLVQAKEHLARLMGIKVLEILQFSKSEVTWSKALLQQLDEIK
jgi:CheY-like chemotaxis protein